MKIRDVLIIGAGAAGSTAAFHLAKAGRTVTLLEMNAQERLKPCGAVWLQLVQKWFPFDLMPVVDEVINELISAGTLQTRSLQNYLVLHLFG